MATSSPSDGALLLSALLILTLSLPARTAANGETCGELLKQRGLLERSLATEKAKQKAYIETTTAQLANKKVELEGKENDLREKDCPVPKKDEGRNIEDLILPAFPEMVRAGCAKMAAKAKAKSCQHDPGRKYCAKLAFRLCEAECTKIADVTECALETGHVARWCLEAVHDHAEVEKAVKHLEAIKARKLAMLAAKEAALAGVDLRLENAGCSDQEEMEDLDEGEQELQNLALGKPAEQSSTFVGWGDAKALSADLAVDGNRDTDLNKVTSSCMHTATWETTGQWWRVDLQGQHSVHAVTITNRGDCCGDRLKNFIVFVDAEKPTYPSRGHPCVTVGTIAEGATVEYECQEPIRGRYVTVYLPIGILQLCEVEVLGLPTSH